MAFWRYAPRSVCGSVNSEFPTLIIARVGLAALSCRIQLAGYGVYPDYYRYVGEINRRGPNILGGLPEISPLTPTQVHHHMTHGLPLIDGRPRAIFANEHICGVVNIELDASFGVYVGWLLPFNKPLLLLLGNAADRAEAVAQLIRIGYDELHGYLEGGMDAWKAAGLPTQSFAAISVDELYRRWRQNEHCRVLDVRDVAEWQSGHIPGAQHIHVGNLPQRLHEIPREAPVATICASGFRAEIAASILSAQGYDIFAVQAGGVPDWIDHGWPTEDGVLGISAAQAHDKQDHTHP